MSGNADDEKEPQKIMPLDLAKTQAIFDNSGENKGPLLMTSQSLRGMRVLPQGTVTTNQNSVGGPTIITTNILSQAVIKPEAGRNQVSNVITTGQNQTQSGGLAVQRPTHISLSTAPLINQNNLVSCHVPRGPAAVANLAAPRSNITTVRAPMVVTVQSGPSFIRPPRTPSPAQQGPTGTAWLTTNTANGGSQLKGAPTVLSSPVRGATVTTGKQPPVITRTQPVVGAQAMAGIRPGTIIQNAINIGQNTQIQSVKSGVSGIQALSNTVTIAQVLPARTQAVVYSSSSPSQFGPTTKLSAVTTAQVQRQAQVRPMGPVTTARITAVPTVTHPIGTARMVVPPQQPGVAAATAVLTGGAKLSVTTTQTQGARLVAGAANQQHPGTIGRISVATAAAAPSAGGQPRISTINLHSLVAVAGGGAAGQARAVQQQQGGGGPKVVTQPAQGTIHLTPISSQIKTTVASAIVTTGNRTINVPAAIVTQHRASSNLPAHTQGISIAKVFPQNEVQAGGAIGASTGPNVFIKAPLQSAQRRPAPSASPLAAVSSQTASATPTTTTTAAFSIANNTFFYDTANQRPFGQHSTAFAAVPQQQPSNQTQQGHQQHQQTAPNSQPVHSLVPNQTVRVNSLMVVDRNRGQPYQLGQSMHQTNFHQQNQQQPESSQTVPSKITSSPRPSILRKRDHEGSPLKAAKNLIPVLENLPLISQSPHSPPSRPDSAGNGNSSGGSTTISATSSPGLTEINEDSNPPVLMNRQDDEDVKPPLEMSPRKKPRKQQLTGNEMDEHHDDMQFISESMIKKENEDSDENQTDDVKDNIIQERTSAPNVRKPANATLLNSYKQTWKATHNHYQRYSDVRPKDERRPSIMDLANQYRVQEKVNGWKIYHLSTQMEDLADQENAVYNHLTELLKCTESEENCKQFDKEVNKINELIKGNLQRIKIINDEMIEAKTKIMKILDHKVHVTDIINRCASKRNFKKREK